MKLNILLQILIIKTLVKKFNSFYKCTILQIVKKPKNFGKMGYLHLKDYYNQGPSQTDILGWATRKLKIVTR